MSDDKQLHAKLARYMDLKAFDAKKVGKEQAAALKVRREIATKRARAALRFFLIPDNLARLNAHAARDRDAGLAGDPQGLHSEGAAARPEGVAQSHPGASS